MGQFLSTLDLHGLLVLVALLAASLVALQILRPGKRGTALRGPPRCAMATRACVGYCYLMSHLRESILFGQSNVLREAGPEGAARIQATWTAEYGTVFHQPGPLGSKTVVGTIIVAPP
jgi:hypothetical protein